MHGSERITSRQGVHVHCHRRQAGVHVRLREEQMNGSMRTSTGPMVAHAVYCWHSLISDDSSHTSDGSDRASACLPAAFLAVLARWRHDGRRAPPPPRLPALLASCRPSSASSVPPCSMHRLCYYTKKRMNSTTCEHALSTVSSFIISQREG